MKTIKLLLGTAMTVLTIALSNQVQAQSKPRLIVNQIEAQEVMTSSKQLGDIIRFEFQKTKMFEVVEHYDVVDQLKGTDITPETCLSLKCMTQMGKQMKAQKVVSGRVSRYGEKIVISLRMVDVATETVEKSEVVEFLNIEKEIQQISGIAVKKMLGIEVDPLLENYLIDKDAVNNEVVVNTLSLNGPRMGVGYVGGRMGEVLMEKEENGGYGAIPVITQFGYQHEVQYMGAGNFQGLFEFIGMVGGMEQGMFIPSMSIMNGFRNSKTGIEFAFGPSFSLAKRADMYQDDAGNWVKGSDWVAQYDTLGVLQNPRPATTSRLDSRGTIELETGWVWALGKTFRSGHLNIPVNLYVSHKKDGFMTGVSVGFNLRNK